MYSERMEIDVENIQFEYVQSDVRRKTGNI